MNMEVYQDGEKLDLENISITRYENKVFQLGEKLNEIELDYSSISLLKGNKDLLAMSFLDEFVEQVNI
jgi:hypothetical protein